LNSAELMSVKAQNRWSSRGEKGNSSTSTFNSRDPATNKCRSIIQHNMSAWESNRILIAICMPTETNQFRSCIK
jgi:hypothetical protein